MKRISHILLSTILLLAVFSCEEVDYKNMNIAQHEEEIDIKEFVGDLTSHIVIKNLNNESITEVDMGESFYVIDNSQDAIDGSEWNVTQGSNSATYNKKLERLSFPKPGMVKIDLTSTRSSDGKSVTSSANVNVKSIPVGAEFSTDPAEEGGVVSIFAGGSVSFTTTVEGSPTIFDWKIVGPETLTSEEQNPTVTFMQEGTYSVTFTAQRDDGEAGISEAVVEKVEYIKVEKLVVELVRAKATDNKIELEYSKPIAQDITSDAKSQYAVAINTAKGGNLTPDVLAVSAINENTIELSFGDKMFSDDEVLVTFTPAGDIKDATGLVILEAFENEPCVYGKAMAWGDTEDQSKFAKTWNTANNDGIFEFVNENSPELAQKPYQGNSCIVITRGSASTGVSLLQGYDVSEGDVFEFAYEALSIENVPGALERRMSTTAGDGSNAAGGNWMSAKDNGKGTGEWMTVKKTINVSANTKGKTGTLYFHFLRYGGGSDTAAIWIDNLRIYKPDPRP